MPGTFAPNPHGGSRSEILADYLFSQWGTVNPVRWQDDYGVDLYCTLSETMGKRAVVRDYFTVQVKSNLDPWIFPDQESVRWLVEYPTPLFLAVVDKKKGVVRVYHVMPMFYAQALGNLPNRIELNPEDTEDGNFVQWEQGGNVLAFGSCHCPPSWYVICNNHIRKYSRHVHGGMPGDLGQRVCTRLNSAALTIGLGPAYFYLGLDTIGKTLANDPLVKRFVEVSEHNDLNAKR
jgi:hypothetical protein